MTPMMEQYFEVKEQYKDFLLFYRLGDFYEMFFDDAITASRVLELTLTGRDCGEAERAPMCGVPHHAIDTYVSRLVEKGYRVFFARITLEDVAGTEYEPYIFAALNSAKVMVVLVKRPWCYSISANHFLIEVRCFTYDWIICGSRHIILWIW